MPDIVCQQVRTRQRASTSIEKQAVICQFDSTVFRRSDTRVQACCLRPTVARGSVLRRMGRAGSIESERTRNRNRPVRLRPPKQNLESPLFCPGHSPWGPAVPTGTAPLLRDFPATRPVCVLPPDPIESSLRTLSENTREKKNLFFCARPGSPEEVNCPAMLGARCTMPSSVEPAAFSFPGLLSTLVLPRPASIQRQSTHARHGLHWPFTSQSAVPTLPVCCPLRAA